MPQRIQRKRTKGWRMPPNTVYVGRGSRFGNPFDWREGVEVGGERWAKGAAVELYRQWLSARPIRGYLTEQERALLRGKNLACWCKLDEPCHADVLMRIANL